jgi:hypothetical protein
VNAIDDGSVPAPTCDIVKNPNQKSLDLNIDVSVIQLLFSLLRTPSTK